MEKMENGGIYVAKGTALPFLCPECKSVIPFNDSTRQKCWACDYEDDAEAFQVEWQFVKPS